MKGKLTPARESTIAARVSRFQSEIYPKVHGWLGRRLAYPLQVVAEYHEERGIKGSILEIGVHHGQFFMLLNALRQPEDLAIAIDIFEQQELNIDSSGEGSRNVFVSHFEDFYPGEREKLKVVTADSLSYSPSSFAQRFGNPGIRFFSVDGGHTELHAFNDLLLAQEVLVPSGVVILDDYLGPHWPGVTQGLFRFLSIGNRRLAPFLSMQNKLLLTTLSEHDQMLKITRAGLERLLGNEARTDHWRYVNLFNFSILAYA